MLAALLLPASGWAWERNTHEELTDKAIEIVEADLNAYLINNLGLEGGLNALISGGTPRKLMIQGSNMEDNGIRFVNHFHDPLSNKGSRILGGISSIIWSLEPVGAQAGGDSFSWNDAREYYFRALTSKKKVDRDIYWGKTFRALGQVMHLIQDSANPSHVRDDLHPIYDGLHDYMSRQSVGSYYTGGGLFSPNPTLLQILHTGGPPPDPLANLFDTNTYNGNNPGATLGTNVGISEFTSANFFSDDTIPGQSGTLLPLHPNAFELVSAVVPLPYLTLPRLGSAAFPAARAAKFTGNQAVAQFLLTHTHFDLIGKLELDNVVYDAQAQNLIPRAVDYSAAVLDYFFRGTVPVGATYYCFQPGFQSTPPSIYFAVDVDISVPGQFQDGGEFYSYVDRPDGQRENMDSFLWESSRLGIPFSMGALFVGDDWGQPGPQRVTIVYEGKLGPNGAEEPKGVVGTTHTITNFIEPCLQ